MRQPTLPLWNRVNFVDWHGVLSRDPFWTSILGRPRHPPRTVAETKLGEVAESLDTSFAPHEDRDHLGGRGLAPA